MKSRWSTTSERSLLVSASQHYICYHHLHQTREAFLPPSSLFNFYFVFSTLRTMWILSVGMGSLCFVIVLICDFSFCSFNCFLNFSWLFLNFFVSYLCVFHVVACVAWYLFSFLHVFIVLHLPLHDHVVVMSRVL